MAFGSHVDAQRAHSPAAFDIQYAASVQEIDPAAWDHLAAGRPFASHRWYWFGETVLSGDSPVYVILSYHGEPVARATFWLTSQEPLPVASGLMRSVLYAAIRRWPLFLCRSPFASTTGLILPDSPLRDPALNTLTAITRDLSRQHRVSFTVFDYLDHEAKGLHWPNAFMRVDGLDPGTRLDITWADFESYVGDLRKSVRKDYRRHCNRAADLGIEITYHDHVDDVEIALALIQNVEQHHGSSPNPYARHMLENAGMVDGTWITATIEDRMVGCGLLLGDGSTRFLALLGLDYEVRYAYFQLVYAAIQRAIELGTTVLRGGGGAYDLKSRLGFEPERDNHLMFSVTNPMLRWLARRLAAGAQSTSILTEEDNREQG